MHYSGAEYSLASRAWGKIRAQSELMGPSSADLALWAFARPVGATIDVLLPFVTPSRGCLFRSHGRGPARSLGGTPQIANLTTHTRKWPFLAVAMRLNESNVPPGQARCVRKQFNTT